MRLHLRIATVATLALGVGLGACSAKGDDAAGHEPLVGHVPFRTAHRRSNGEPIPKSEVAHFGVCFDGMLIVTDADAMTAAVRDGIGAAKAFGFGLLSLAPG